MSPTYAPDCPCTGLALNAMLFMQIDLVVATPKRLSHLVKAKQVDLSAVQFLILDEADKLFELGFQSHIDSIIGACSNSNIVSHSAQCYGPAASLLEIALALTLMPAIKQEPAMISCVMCDMSNKHMCPN